MGRNQRHKKDVRAEKAKVKLKQTKTKFLPKGLNVTNTNFKIKPIVLSEQLKEKRTDIPLSKRKLDVKDLLSRIKHYNENVRHRGCEELEEMVKVHSEEIINHHLSDIVLNISVSMQDREHKVRKAIVKVINAILESIPEAKLEPFYGYFSTNLCCAMTNIDKNIQEHSLEYLDCFLKHAPGFISETSEKLLPNFFSLISNLRSGSNLGRLLTINLNSKMTSVTWRIKVLSRLHAVLESILHNTLLNRQSKETNYGGIYYPAYGCNTFPIYKDTFLDALETPVMGYGNIQAALKGTDILNRHIITLVPLLYETWLEVVPEKKIGKSVTEYMFVLERVAPKYYFFLIENTVLNEEASAILSCVMNTLYLLWVYVKKIENEAVNISNTFLSNDGKKFLSHLLTNFPYCQMERKAKQKKGTGMRILQTNNDPKCVKENLLICYMYCVLNINYLHNNLKIEMEAISKYIARCLLSKKYIDNSNVDVMIEFLKDCLVENPQTWKRGGADLKSILENTITFYSNNVLTNKYRIDFFNILLGVADISLLNKSQQYTTWISSLPDLLCQSKITDLLVDALLRLSRKNNEIFYTALLKKIPTILDNLESLNIVLTNTNQGNSEEVVKRNIANMFFFLPVLYLEQIEAISDFIMTHSYSTYAIYFADMLKLRLEMKNTGNFENNLKSCSVWKKYSC